MRNYIRNSRVLSCFESLSTNALLSGHPEGPAYGVSKGATRSAVHIL